MEGEGMRISEGNNYFKVCLTESLFSERKKSTEYVITKTVLQKIDDSSDIDIHEMAASSQFDLSFVLKLMDTAGGP